jgi:DNA mismatch repair protein MSH4
MTMLYRAVEGSVEESHYGLALARLVPLPPKVISDATYLAHKLERRLQQKKKTSKNVIAERRRKLILDLKEHLVQAYKGTLEGDLLASWLKELQKEFVNRMTAIDEDEKGVVVSEDEDEDEEGNVEMGEDTSDDEEMIDAGNGSWVATTEPSGRPPTVTSIDSRFSSSTESVATLRPASEAMSSVRAVSENMC